MKDDAEVAQEAQEAEEAEAAAPEGSSLVEEEGAGQLRAAAADPDVTEDPNIRVCIVNCESDPSMFERVPIDIFSKTIGDLTELLKKQFGVEGSYRIRNTQRNKLYAKEEVGMLLKNFEQFVEGGARLTLESGEYCSITEVAVKILFGDEEKNFNFSSSFTLMKCKEQICAAFDVNPTKYTLFRLDGFGEAAFPIKKEKAGWAKNNVSSGETLMLKSNSELTMEDKITISVHHTGFGLPDDCTFIGQIEVSKKLSLDDLKSQIATMPHFVGLGNVVAKECMRVRDLTPSNRYFGRIHRDLKKSLEQLSLKNNSHIVVQLLDEPEQLDEQTLVLLICRRNVETRTYSEKVPHKFTYKKEDRHPTIQNLKASCRELFQLDQGEHIDICKFIPWQFEWRFLDPN